MGTIVFLDSWLLRGYVSSNTLEASDARHQLSKLESNSYSVFIPQIVIGETISTMLRDFPTKHDLDNKLSKLTDTLQSILDLRKNLPPLTMLVVDKAHELIEMDSVLDNTDALIASHALMEPYSQRLLTDDRKLLDSEAIKEMDKRMNSDRIRKKRLKIVDGL